MEKSTYFQALIFLIHNKIYKEVSETFYRQHIRISSKKKFGGIRFDEGGLPAPQIIFFSITFLILNLDGTLIE